MKKKLISTLLAFSLLAATLAGCGSKEEQAPANEQATTQEETAEADENANGGGH